METTISTLDELYRDRNLYSSPDMFSPPSERLAHVIRFELTTGCTWKACTYCNGYRDITTRTKSREEYKEHLRQVWRRMDRDLVYQLSRIFIGGGNALSVETEDLIEALSNTKESFLENAEFEPRRVSIYGRTTDIIEKGGDLRKLNSSAYYTQLDLIYWGVESGSTRVLDYIVKGYTLEEIKQAALILRDAGIKSSVMIMPGLGGIRFYKEHVEETAQALEAINPDFLTFMGINPAEDTAYSRIMRREQEAGENRPLTNRELATQMIEIIEHASIPHYKVCRIGCFNTDVDAVGHNPLTFGSKKVEDYYDRSRLASQLRRHLETIR